jgi:hypothetical protein
MSNERQAASEAAEATAVETQPVVETPIESTESAEPEITAGEKVETAPTKDEKPKLLTQEQVNAINARTKRELEAKHREELAYWRGKAEASQTTTKPQQETYQPQTPIARDYTFPEQLQSELQQVDAAFQDGRFNTYEDYLTQRNLIAVQYSYQQMIQQQEVQKRVMQAKRELDERLDTLEETNPGAKTALDMLDKSPYAQNRNIAVAVLGGGELGAKIGIYLGKNLQEAKRISSIPNEWEQVQELQKLAEKLKPQSVNTISNAPKPPTGVNAKPSPSSTPTNESQLTLEQQVAAEAERMSAGRRGRSRQ